MASVNMSMRAGDYLSGMTIQVCFTGIGIARARLWIAQRVMRLAGYIAGTNLEINLKE